MTIVNRYIMKEVLLTLLGVLGLLFLIFLSTRFVMFLAAAASGTLPSEVVLNLLGLKTLSTLPQLLPYALYISILLAFGRLYKDNEMIALAACGVGTRKIIGIILAFSVTTAVAVGTISLYFAPWAERQSALIRDQVKANSEMVSLAPGRFSESARGNGVFFTEEMSRDGKIMHRVFIQADNGDHVETVSSESARLETDGVTGERFLVLKNGYRYEREPGSAKFNIIKFEEHGVRLDEREVTAPETHHDARSSLELWKDKGLSAAAELQGRFSMPIATILLGLLAVPLSRTSPRQGRYAKLFTAVLILVIYSNMLGVAQSWYERSIAPPAMGIWWVHVVFMVFIVIVFIRQMGMSWFMRVLSGKDV